MTQYSKSEKKAIKAIYLSNSSEKGSRYAQRKFSSYQYWLDKANHLAFYQNRFI